MQVSSLSVSGPDEMKGECEPRSRDLGVVIDSITGSRLDLDISMFKHIYFCESE